VRWIMGVLLLRFLYGHRAADDQGEGGSNDGTSMVPIGDGNGEGEAMGCGRFQRGRRGGGEEAPRC
jgi:hypothetical protein